MGKYREILVILYIYGQRVRIRYDRAIRESLTPSLQQQRSVSQSASILVESITATMIRDETPKLCIRK